MRPSSTRIVIADDNIEFMNILREFLSEKSGFEVVGTAANGLEAIEIISKNKPDIVLLDIVMPQLDGLGVLEKLRSYHAKRKTQFIVLTAIGSFETTQIALTLGADYYIIKPFDFEELVLRIRQLQSFKNKNELRPVGQKPEPGAETSIASQIKRLLDIMGVPSHVKGYQYLIFAISLVVQDLSAIHSIKKAVYTSVAHEYKTTQTRVERAIRNAIELTWNKGNIDRLFTMFEYDMNDTKTRPSNSEFIITVANEFWNNSSVID